VKGLGSIPVLGALFRSKDFQDRRSEMVVMVTPRLIQPNDAFHRQKEAWAEDHKAKRGMGGIDIKSKSQDTPSLNQDEQAQEVRHD
jgi:Flp pilus assembly secretin CpaC